MSDWIKLCGVWKDPKNSERMKGTVKGESFELLAKLVEELKDVDEEDQKISVVVWKNTSKHKKAPFANITIIGGQNNNSKSKGKTYRRSTKKSTTGWD